MIIKETSTQSFNENGERPYLFRNSKDYPPKEWERILQYLKRNAEANLLKYEVIEPWKNGTHPEELRPGFALTYYNNRTRS